MALEVEDGTAKDDAESYISVTDADTYFTNRGDATWAALTSTAKEQALRKGTDYMGQVYRLRWKGTRVSGTQALDWPRNFVLREDYAYASMNGAAMIGGDFYYPADEVPIEVQRACAELALRSVSADLAPDIGRLKKRVKVDVIETEYADYAPASTQYRAIDNLLSPFLTGGGSSVKLVRA